MPCGKLYYAYKNTVAKLRKGNLFPREKKRKLEESKKTLCSHQPSKLTSTRAPSDEKIWLKYHSEPWLIVEEKWNATVNERKAEFKSCDQTNITLLLAEWPAYMKENGQRLIDIDFDSQFTGRINKLHEKWGDFVVKIIPYFKKNIKDKQSLELLKGLQNQDLNIASEKIDVNGSTLVLERNGTPINEDEVLIFLKNDILMLLAKNEQWGPSEQSLGSASTLTVSSVNEITDTSINDMSDGSTLNNSILAEISDNTFMNINAPVIVDANLEYTWAHLDVSWSKIPSNHLSLLESGKKWQNCKPEITEICHTIVHEMRAIKTRIPVAAFKQMANKIVTKYPATFRETDIDGVVIGDGTYFLIRKLIDRNNYLNRPHKRGWENSPTPPKYRKKKMNSVAGCSNWEESASPSEDQSLQEKLKNIKESDEKYYDLLEDTYSDQRIFLNNVESPPTVQDIKKNWPVLLTNSGVKWHFQKVTGVDLNTLKFSMEEKAEKIIKYGIKKKLCDSQYDENKDTEECLKFYGKYFKEDLSKSILVRQDEKRNPGDLPQLIPAPCILETYKEGVISYKVFLEREEIFEDTSFIESFLFCFGLYFVMNLMFPKEAAATLEMIQRFHLKIHPDSGTKSKSASKGKVLTLMKNLTSEFT
ncbi:unnamed protein product [Brassicogethes aeneus]|uniref:Uncharacterized protein n=1 Tax=Brassicogethes aeneus TaxID=1431903 RepID=A0A9P0BB12_BRAAE|nr:unnamed protein product [Brassicogethes aeneus]